MPRDLADTVSTGPELVFPDSAPGETYKLYERSVYSASEVQDEIEQDLPRYGDWILVIAEDLQGGAKAFLNAPANLRQELVEKQVTEGQRFTVTELAKSGHQESDPYQATIEVEEPAESRNASLSEATGDD